MAKKSLGSSGQYEVGHGRPPIASRFKPGRSGNPKGRPRGRHRPEAMLIRAMSELVDIRVNGRVKKLPALMVLFLRMRNRALEGDLKACAMLVSWLRASDLDQQSSGEGHDFTVDRRAILRLIKDVLPEDYAETALAPISTEPGDGDRR
jgi:hypothetical protein